MAIAPQSGLTRLIQNTVGPLLARVADAVGIKAPEKLSLAKFGDRYNDSVEPSTLLLMRTLDKMFGRTQVIEGFVPPPEAFRQFGFGGDEPKGFARVGSTPGQAPYGGGKMGLSIAAALKTDPTFKARFEKQLGGMLVPSGSTGNVRLYDGPPPRATQFAGLATSPDAMNATAHANHVPTPNPQLAPILGALQNFEMNARSAPQQQSAAPTQQSPIELALGSVTTTIAKTQPRDIFSEGAPPISGAMQAQMSGGGQQQQQRGMAQAMEAGQAAAGGGQQLSDTMKQQMLQAQMETLNRIYTLLSNILAQMHSMQNAAINNIK